MDKNPPAKLPGQPAENDPMTTMKEKAESQERDADNNQSSANPKRGIESVRTNVKNQYRNEGLSGR